jgi:hypothetical protein
MTEEHPNVTLARHVFGEDLGPTSEKIAAHVERVNARVFGDVKMPKRNTIYDPIHRRGKGPSIDPLQS